MLLPFVAVAQQRLEGRVVENTPQAKPVAMAVVELPKLGLWAVADAEGYFILEKVPSGTHLLVASCLGYVMKEVEITVPLSHVLELKIDEDNLTLAEVVVTAKESDNALSTTRTIGSNALDHLQMMSASDIATLLPGGKTVNPDLLSDENSFSLRSGGLTTGNAAFATAVEVDGVRLSNNASLGDVSGISTRNIASTNIESVEVITGVPSAEYGDVGSGMVRISTRKGVTPWTVQMATNPRTKQLSLAKGFAMGDKGGVINASAEYTRATKNPTSPYTSYTRTGLSLAYSNTFARVWRFSAGVTGNIGGMNTEDDPDAYVGAWSREREAVVRANASLIWLLHRPWITDLHLDASVNYADNLTKSRSYLSNATLTPAVHAEQEGYYLATMLPATCYPVQYVDSKQLDYAASLKAKWIHNWSGGKGLSNLRLGFSWKAEGNVGEGEYYEDPSIAPNGYRPYPYTRIPYMHNLALWIEETLTLPIGATSLTLMAGLRGEKTLISGTNYSHTSTLSPRLNLRWRLSDAVTVRGGWGLAEKLPSLGVLYPRPQYTDIRTFDASWATGSAYVYYTRPYEMLYNEDLRWQRNRNTEVAVEFSRGEWRFALAGYFNRTKNPYRTVGEYTPMAYSNYRLPDGYAMPENPLLKVDSQTGEIFVRDQNNYDAGWVALVENYVNQTYTRTLRPANGSPVDRYGVELTAEFPMIRPLRTELRLDAAYTYTKYVNEGLAWYYPSVSSTVDSNRSYEYVGIYADNGSSSTVTYNGCKNQTLDMNLTTTTHIPAIRLVVTLRLEASLLKRSQNLSLYNGSEYAYNVDEAGNPTGGSIYDGNSYTAIRPLYYMSSDGIMRPFTDVEAADPRFANLILRSSTVYQYNTDGYDPYFSANLSITKEIGDIASISFYANNFTNSRRYVSSHASGVRVIKTPAFYYGLSLRLKF